MTPSLQIDVPQFKYRPGHTVTGVVRLVSQHTFGQGIDVGSITIELTGKCTTTKNWPPIPHPVQLFSFKKTLLNGPKRLHVPVGHTENGIRNEWNFNFTLPSNCDVIERSSVSSSTFFNSDPNQPVPTTFKDDGLRIGSCSIAYELQATLLSPVTDGYYTNEACMKKVEIFVDRGRRIEQPGYIFNTKLAAFTHRSLLLLPREEREMARRPASIKEKLKLKTPSTENLPKAVFTVRVQTPSAAIVGQPLPLIVHVDYDTDASTVPPPVFHIKRISIHLCEETFIAGFKRPGETESMRWTKEITLHEKRFELKGLGIEEHLDLRNVMDTAVPHYVTPTFKTFNIARTYSVKIYVRLESCGREHAVYGDYKPCRLFAESYDPRTTMNDTERASTMEVDENDPPPPYDLVAREAVPEYSQSHHIRNHEIGHTWHDEATVSVRAASHNTATAPPGAVT